MVTAGTRSRARRGRCVRSRATSVSGFACSPRRSCSCGSPTSPASAVGVLEARAARRPGRGRGLTVSGRTVCSASTSRTTARGRSTAAGATDGSCAAATWATPTTGARRTATWRSTHRSELPSRSTSPVRSVDACASRRATAGRPTTVAQLVDVDITTELELHAGEQLLRVTTEWDNRCRINVYGCGSRCPRRPTDRGRSARSRSSTVDCGRRRPDRARSARRSRPSGSSLAGGLTVVHEGVHGVRAGRPTRAARSIAMTLARCTGLLVASPDATRPLPAGTDHPRRRARSSRSASVPLRHRTSATQTRTRWWTTCWLRCW